MNDVEKDINILSNFFIENKDIASEFEEYSNIIEDNIYNKLFNSFNKTFYTRKQDFIYECSNIIESIKFLIKIPELIGKTIVGIIPNNKDESYLNIMHSFYNKKIYNYMFPIVIYNGNENDEVRIINNIDNIVMMDRKDYYHITKKSFDYKLNLKSFVKCAAISENINLSNTVFIHFPSSMDFEYSKYLFQFLDVLILTDDSINKFNFELLQKNLDAYILLYSQNNNNKKLCDKYEIKIYKDIDSLKNYISARDDLVNKNYSFADKYIFEYSNVIFQCSNLVNQKESILGKVNEDIVKLSDKNIENIIKNIKDDILNELDILNKTNQKFYRLVKQIEKYFYDLENQMEKKFIGKKLKLKDGYKYNMQKSYLNFLYSNDNNKAEEISQKLINEDNDFLYINKLYKEQFNNKLLSKDSLDYIKNFYYDDKASICQKLALANFQHELNINAIQLGKLLFHLEEKHYHLLYSFNAKELLLLGDYYYSLNNEPEATKYYEKSLRKNSPLAYNKLINIKSYISNKKNIHKLVNICSDKNITYEYALLLKSEKDKSSMSYIKMAAALGNSDAILDMANYYFYKAKSIYVDSKNSNSGADTSVYEKYNNNSLVMYQYLLSKNDLDRNKLSDIYYKVGFIYYNNGDKLRALTFLSKSNKDAALTLMANIYYKNEDYDEAINMYEQSYKIFKNEKSLVELNKLKGRKKAIEIKKNKNNELNNVYYKEEKQFKKSEWCFITTATYIALGKDYDCDEIRLFHNYRDEHLIKDEDGEKLISEYYEIAPNIVENINKLENYIEIYKYIYYNYINKIYNQLLIKNYSRAKKMYIDMVLSLKEKFYI
ncbi:tetratricopeptide repeat protein [Brachyspira pilosicoli]|uniref:Tetratricopeptide repeat protein n=1 Tax=Brachyspira pilosicoli TaxID=52584 RepID=A0A5C8F4I2_BRAPL|nr:tetratricopeptide repeat protein [Brachyspira pilosicoli]TXJ44946.1 tetratricopeptide repeat protein [Brachyspira pilosicoli]